MECQLIRNNENSPFIQDEYTIYYIRGIDSQNDINFYFTLSEILGGKHLRVVYLPLLISRLDAKTISYNFPHLDATLISEMAFYRKAYHFLGIEMTSTSRHIVRYDKASNAFLCFDFSGTTDEEFFGRLQEAAQYIKVKEPKQSEKLFSFNKTAFDLLSSLPEDRQIEELRKISEDTSLPADERFDANQYLTGLQVKKALIQLILDGFQVEIVQGWLKDAQRLSRLKVTKDYRILLTDYNKEIELFPLDKAVYIFYLRHDEGCRFKNLSDHKKELLEIYDKIAITRDPEENKRSIDILCNDYGKSINEKASRIKRAFLSQLTETIASQYYLTGKKGSPKRIELDRKYLIWE